MICCCQPRKFNIVHVNFSFTQMTTAGKKSTHQCPWQSTPTVLFIVYDVTDALPTATQQTSTAPP